MMDDTKLRADAICQDFCVGPKCQARDACREQFPGIQGVCSIRLADCQRLRREAPDAIRKDGEATPDATGAMECLIGGCDRPDCMVCRHYVDADGATPRNDAADATQSDLAKSTGIVDDGQGGAK